jgi:hypothetical protein
MIPTDKAINAAIIGYWRNGMTNEEIRMVTNLSTFDIERIIFNYSKGIK